MSTAINEEMKMAAVKALAQLAKEDVPESVSRAYGGQKFRFGREYLIPKPFDRRALLWVAPAVAEAAIQSGVATQEDRYRSVPRQFRDASWARLTRSCGGSRIVSRRCLTVKSRATIVFPEGENPKIFVPRRSCAKRASPSLF